MKSILILIAGGTASGKTHFAKQIIKHFEKQENNPSVQLIALDNYYENQDHISFEERKKVNYDHPNAYDWNKLHDDFEKLLSNQEIKLQKYNHELMTHGNKEIIIKPSNIYIIEGIFALFDKYLVNKATLKIYIDAAPDVRLLRRLERDFKREKLVESLDRFIRQWNQEVRPMHDEFIAPSKRNANLIIPNSPNEYNYVALSVILSKIDEILNTYLKQEMLKN